MDEFAAALDRIAREDAIGQLRRREGAMARLGSEGDALKLDWVEAVPWLLAHPEALAQVEREAHTLLAGGVRHVIWAGMGGSVLTVQTFAALGFASTPAIAIHPLDSTDPAALNSLLQALAASQGQPPLTPGARPDESTLRALLSDVALVAVAMGMTSEEPISHLEWFLGALQAAGLSPSGRVWAMSLPGSYLDQAAQARGVPRLPLQLDGGTGTGGRMSAPGTRVFLLPAALWLAGQGAPAGSLEAVLRRAWVEYDVDGAERDPAGNQYVRLAAALFAASVDGAVGLFYSAPGAWAATRDWLEQLMEESLGKGGKGVVVFPENARPSGQDGAISVRLTPEPEVPPNDGDHSVDAFSLRTPLIGAPAPQERLAGLAALFLGLQLGMALYGYLHDIPFAGQPAVENYKARTRALLADPDGAAGWPGAIPPSGADLGSTAALHVLPPGDASPATDPIAALAPLLRALLSRRPLPYLDVTINGEAPAEALAALDAAAHDLAVERLHVPYKLRRAPAAYHSTEQSEMDGPPALVSLRALALDSAEPIVGDYSARFLRAQAVATWRAMAEVGRPCALIVSGGDTSVLLGALTRLLRDFAAAV